MSLFGAVPCEGGVRFQLWGPAAHDLTLLLRRAGIEERHTPARDSRGVWTTTVRNAHAGDRYAYSIDGSEPRPDPASRFQPDGVHGWSQIVDPTRFRWTDAGWRGIDARDAVLYELHVGTFTEGGTFAEAASRLEYLRDLGITAIELMPIADFPGARNWGYDGVSLFAPSRAYGDPEALRAFVDRAHALGLAVIFDVVYNHLGPEGAYLPSFSPQFLTDKHETPWGKAVNLDDEGCAVVRALLTDNAQHWIREYHADGLRLDATHALIDTNTPPFVAELVARARAAAGRRVLVYAEDCRNLAIMVQDPAEGGWGFDGVWADDFHHIVRRMLAGDAYGYYRDYDGTSTELAQTLARGWLYVGQYSEHERAPRGTDPSRVPMRKAIICVQNHDQIGNRAMGDRLHHGIDAPGYRAAVAVLLLAPMTPLLFMGQEWAASTPFQFFTDFAPTLGEKVIEGRRREFRAFPEFATPAAAERIPDPQAEATFAASRLNWAEQSRAPHSGVLALHTELLRLRAAHGALRGADAPRCNAWAPDEDSVAFIRTDDSGAPAFLVCARLRGVGPVMPGRCASHTRWTPVLTTEDRRFTVDAAPPAIDASGLTITFARPGAVLLAACDE